MTAVLFILLVDVDKLLLVSFVNFDLLSSEKFDLFPFVFYHVSRNKTKMKVNKSEDFKKRNKFHSLRFNYTL